MSAFDQLIADAKARVKAAEAALGALPRELTRELDRAEYALRTLQRKARRERYESDLVYEAIFESAYRSDLNTSEDAHEQIGPLEEFIRILGTYDYDIVRRSS